MMAVRITLMESNLPLVARTQQAVLSLPPAKGKRQWTRERGLALTQSQPLAKGKQQWTRGRGLALRQSQPLAKVASFRPAKEKQRPQAKEKQPATDRTMLTSRFWAAHQRQQGVTTQTPQPVDLPAVRIMRQRDQAGRLGAHLWARGRDQRAMTMLIRLPTASNRQAQTPQPRARERSPKGRPQQLMLPWVKERQLSQGPLMPPRLGKALRARTMKTGLRWVKERNRQELPQQKAPPWGKEREHKVRTMRIWLLLRGKESLLRMLCRT
jgi:hypothetical protein